METLKRNPKDLVMSKADKRVLLKYLEKFYTTKLYAYNFHTAEMQGEISPTQQTKYERRFRLRIKAVETILHELGSTFMQDVKIVNHRKTSEINARNVGLIKD
jgi:hypothetical protein